MSRNNTGNPIDSKAFADFEDNVANFDQWSISDADSFKDRKGEERLTLKGTERAGAGDTSVAVDAAARAVDAAGRAENAEAIVDAANIKAEVDRAEAARDAAFVNADVYPDVATGRAAVADGEQFQVVEGDEIVRYVRNSASTAEEVARYPSAQGADAERQLGLVGRNLFDGVLSEFLIEGTGEVVSRPGLGQTAVIQIEPGALYTVFRGNPTDRLRVSTLSAPPIDGAQSLRSWVGLAELSSGTAPFSIRAEAGESWMVVDVSRSDDIRLHITKDFYDGPASGLPSKAAFPGSVTAQNIKQGKNLFDGEWTDGTILGEIGPATLTITANPGKYTTVPILPGETYTISKTASNRFKVAIWSAGTVKGRIVANDDNSTEFTFTAESGDYLLGVYAAFGEGVAPPAFMQVERSATRTEWETYGYKLAPQAAPYFSNSGSGTDGPDIDISGGEDATEALNHYFQMRTGGDAPLPSGLIKVTGTLLIPGETTVRGHGRSTRIFLEDDFNLTPFPKRGSSVAHPIMCTEPGADHCTFKDFLIVGNRDQMVDHQQFGLAIIDSDYAKVSGVGVEYINYFPESAGSASSVMAYNLAIIRSKHSSVFGGLYQFGGYENIGTEDSEDILFSGVRAGVGWRTSVQFHRGSQDIRWIGGSIYQNHPAAHSALTMHGSVDNPVVGVLVDGLTLKSVTDNTLDGRGGIQTVETREHDITVTNSTIVASNNGVTGGSSQIDPEPCKNWKLSNLRIKAGGYGISMRGRGTQIDNVTIDSVGRALYLQDNNHSVGAVTFLDNQQEIITEPS